MPSGQHVQTIALKIVQPQGGEGFCPGEIMEGLCLSHACALSRHPSHPQAPVHIIAKDKVVPVHHPISEDHFGAYHEQAGAGISDIQIRWQVGVFLKSIPRFNGDIAGEDNIPPGFLQEGRLA